MQARKVLICVDDEPLILMALKFELKLHLTDKDISVNTFMKPTDAFECVDQCVADGAKVILIISDWLMPGMNGSEFLMKVNEKYPEIPMILITGQADAAAIRLLQERIELRAVIHKPWNAAQLKAIVDSCIADKAQGA